MAKQKRSNCPVAFALDVIGDKWSLLILRDVIFLDKKYYNEFEASEEGISTNILADRLQKLERSGLLSKQRDVENKKRFIYSPTSKGLDLLPMIVEMIVWGAKYDVKTGAPSATIKQMKRDREGFIRNLRGKFPTVR